MSDCSSRRIHAPHAPRQPPRYASSASSAQRGVTEFIRNLRRSRSRRTVRIRLGSGCATNDASARLSYAAATQAVNTTVAFPG